MRILMKLLSFTLALGVGSALAADRPVENATSAKPAATQSLATPKADNTELNVRDKSGATLTPQKQTNREADRNLLATVRRAVVGDKTLSTSAHNIKIVARGGVVTLRGPVSSEDEKGRIADLAQQVAGVVSIENQLDVKTK